MAPWQTTCTPPRDLVHPVPLDPEGEAGPTRGQAQRGRWRRTTKGFYVPADVEPCRPEQRILEQSMRLGGGGAVTGWASLRLHGGAYFDGVDSDGRTELPVPLVSPDRQLRALAGSTVTQERFGCTERTVIRGIGCAEVRRAAFDEMRAADLRHAVEVMDMAAAAELTSIRRMAAYLETRARWNRVPLVREALAFADEHSASPGETRARLVWMFDAGLPRPVCNRPLFSTAGRFLGVPDLLDVDAGVVCEYDGSDHLRSGRRHRDLKRKELFRAHGLEYLCVVTGDLREVDRLVDRMCGTRARAIDTAPIRARDWTLTPPPGWSLTKPPLDERLDFRDYLSDMASSQF